MQPSLCRTLRLFISIGVALGASASIGNAQTRSQMFINDTIVVDVPGSGPFLSPVAGDANGDGVPDLLVVRRGGSEFRVLISAGRAEWAEASIVAQLAPEIEIQDVAVGDIDGDHDPDLIYWGLDNTKAQIVVGTLLGDGVGGYSAAPQSFAKLGDVDGPVSERMFDTIALGDVTGDGDLDLVLASRDLVILEGDGEGGFTNPEVINADETSVELADIDGDGTAEIVSAGSTWLRIRQRQEDGWVLVGSRQLEDGFFNETNVISTDRCDGMPGVRILVVAGFNGFSAFGFVEAHDISPDFTTQSGFAEMLPAGTIGITAADVLGGPEPEFILASGDILRVDACDNLLVMPPPTRTVGNLARAADVNLDGVEDIVISSRTGITIMVVEGHGVDRAVSAPPVFEVDTPGFDGSGSGIASGDFDGDGRTDVYFSTGNNQSSAVFYQESDGSFSGSLLTETSRSPRVHAADLDADGLDDVVLITSGINVQVNFGEPGRSFAPRVGYSVGATPREARAADIDNDGDLDIVAHTVDGLSVLKQTAPRVFELGSTLAVPGSFLGLALGDLDGDADTDVVVGSQSDFGVQIALNKGGGTFTQAISIDPSISPESFSLADLDDDGDLDLVVVARSTSPLGVAVYENDGVAGFTRITELGQVSTLVLTRGQWVETGDFDGDGATDIASASVGGDFQMLQGDGAFGFSPVLFYTSITDDLNQFVLDDFNADGYPDLATVFYDARGFGGIYERGLGGVSGGFQLLINQTRPRDLCPADLALPGGVLDLNDIVAFVTGFNGDGDPADADLAAPFGTLDLADIAAFVAAFLDGCG